jgi:hypothetical protein
MTILLRLFREPLLRFFVIGGCFFLVFAAVSDRSPPPADVITITPDRIDRLAAGFTAVWNRQPTGTELDALIDNDVREEVFYREALALGLDRNDAVIRRRMRQKMEFLFDVGADLLEPSEGELEDYLAANAQAFRQGPRLAIEQIFLGEDPAPENIAPLLSALQSDPVVDPYALGVRTLLPARLDLSHPNTLDGMFGEGFFGRIAVLPTGKWAGPVASSYGEHLVHITESEPSRMPPLEEVRDAVLRAWKEARSQELGELRYGQLRERYTIEIRRNDDPAEVKP